MLSEDDSRSLRTVPLFLEKSDLDVVHVLVPPYAHYEIADLALSEGVSVFIEKPITVQAKEAKASF